MKGFYSPIDRLMEQSTRPRGTGAEYMAELSKKPGYKPQEAEDRNLQALMALPKMEQAAFMEKLKANPAVMPKAMGVREPHHEDYTLPGGTNYREILLQHPKGTFPGVEEHFGGAPNVLASIRAKDRVGPNGEKILHLEEIQSDWHERGRKKGYHPKGVDMDKTLDAAKSKHSILQHQLQQAKANSKAVEQRKAAAVNPEEQAMHDRTLQSYNRSIMDLMPQVMRADEELRKTQQLASEGVPDAPFKKDWHELALKKMIHHAAEKGYDQIAITPGAEQAKRYGLAKKLHSIEYSKGKDGKYHVIAIPHHGADLMGGMYELPEIEQYVGKDLTKQIAEDQGALNPRNDAYKVLSGQDLNIGGEGMKGFYDKMVPAFLNKFGKKHGVQVQPGQITEPGGEYVHAPGNFKADTTHAVHTFNITPQMREDVLKNGIPLYAKGGSVGEDVPRETTKAYKMFRVDKKQPGKLFPLFVDADTPVEMNKWIAAKEGEKSAANTKKVKSKIGDLAYRPGWHAGDLPVATHIGEKDDEQKAETQRVRAMRDAHAATLGNTKAAKAVARKEHPYPSWVNAPRLRNPNHIWAEVEMPNDVDWQSEATKRGYNDQGKLIASQAHITDQLPKGGHYRYKTNSNMLGNWLIGGSMKVNRILHDKEVEQINKAAGAADLPRAKAMNQKAFGFAAGGTVGPEEFMAEEHVNYKVKGGSVSRETAKRGVAHFSRGGSDVSPAVNLQMAREAAEREGQHEDPHTRSLQQGWEHGWYHGTTGDIHSFAPDYLGESTGAPSAKQGYFFARDPSTPPEHMMRHNPDSVNFLIKAGKQVPPNPTMAGNGPHTASSYAGTGGSREYKTAMRLAHAAEKKGDWDAHAKHMEDAENAEIKSMQYRQQLVASHGDARDNMYEQVKNAWYGAHNADKFKTMSQPAYRQYDDLYSELMPYGWHMKHSPEQFESVKQHIKQLGDNPQTKRAINAINHYVSVSHERKAADVESGANVIPAALRYSNPMYHDFEGKPYREQSYNDLIKEAKLKGHDALILKNTFDPGGSTSGSKMIDVGVMFHPKQIRSKFAAFHPDRINEPDLLAAKGGVVKEKVTLSPNMDVMQYELLNRKAK